MAMAMIIQGMEDLEEVNSQVNSHVKTANLLK